MRRTLWTLTLALLIVLAAIRVGVLASRARAQRQEAALHTRLRAIVDSAGRPDCPMPVELVDPSTAGTTSNHRIDTLPRGSLQVVRPECKNPLLGQGPRVIMEHR